MLSFIYQLQSINATIVSKTAGMPVSAVKPGQDVRTLCWGTLTAIQLVENMIMAPQSLT